MKKSRQNMDGPRHKMVCFNVQDMKNIVTWMVNLWISDKLDKSRGNSKMDCAILDSPNKLMKTEENSWISIFRRGSPWSPVE